MKIINEPLTELLEGQKDNIVRLGYSDDGVRIVVMKRWHESTGIFVLVEDENGNCYQRLEKGIKYIENITVEDVVRMWL